MNVFLLVVFVSAAMSLTVLGEDVESVSAGALQAKLECDHGLPAVDTVTWYQNDFQIFFKSSSETRSSPRYTLADGDRKLFLIIKDVLATDAGDYTCRAFYMKTNSYETVKVRLQVKGFGVALKYSFSVLVFGFLLQTMI